jgi:hypothetical protein
LFCHPAYWFTRICADIGAFSALDQSWREIGAGLHVAPDSDYINEELRAEAPADSVSEPICKPYTAGDLCDAVACVTNVQSEIAS